MSQVNKSFCYFVSGRVHGVGYRKFVYKRALGLRLCGYVRNLTDGRVEVVVSFHTDEQQKIFENDLRKGPIFARVDDVKRVEISNYDKNNFEILFS